MVILAVDGPTDVDGKVGRMFAKLSKNYYLCNMYSADDFETTYRRYFRALVVYAFDILQEMSLAQDAVQDVFGRLYAHPTDFPTETVARVYLYNGVRNRAISILRRQRTADAYSAQVQRSLNAPAASATAAMPDLPQAAVTDPEADDDFFTPEVMRRLMDAIDQLPDRQREIFLLAMKGKKNQEIAEQLSVAVGTVKTQKQRAINKLRDQFGPRVLLLLPL